MTELPPHRQRCYRCLRPTGHCLCAQLPTVPTRTRVVVLQHPHERTHPFGTARLVRLCLPTASVHVPCAGYTGTLEQRVELPPDAVVLFPSDDAPLLEDLLQPAPPSTLVAIDGTWAHAKRLWRENGWLRQFRHARLQPSEPSRYRIRKEPRADYVSTLEAIVGALRLLEPDTQGLDALLTAFDRMIDHQIDHAAQVQRFGRFKVPRQRPSRALAPQLFDPRLVITYAESALPGGQESATRELVQWVAARVEDGELFEVMLRPRGGLPLAHHLSHMEIDPESVAAGEDAADAARRFAAWLTPGAPVAAWTPTTLDWSTAMLPPDTQRVQLKTNYCNLRNRRAGMLEDVLAHEGLQPVPLACRGRAAQRLGNALAIARWLRTFRRAPDGTGRPIGAPCN